MNNTSNEQNEKNGLQEQPSVILKETKKFLFVSWESLSGDLAWQIKKEGHEVKIYVKNEDDKDVYDGFLEKVDEWKKYVDWSDVVCFDDVGFGKESDELRKNGKLVVGGSEYTDKLEKDREFGQSEMKRIGMLTLPHWDFTDYDAALKFIEETPGRYVYKPSGHTPSDYKGILFLGKDEDGKDLHEILRSNKKVLEKKIKQFQLQKFASGVEIAVGAFFNGNDFIYPINVNFEHKKLFPGDMGPYTGEMGTLLYFSPPNTIFRTTLEKIKGPLKESKYVGYIDINCIANARGIYPLEWTCFSGDTEILTENGWRLIKDIKKSEVVATLNPKSHNFEYQKVINTISKKHSGELIHISGNGNSHEALDCLVTPDHQMYVEERSGKFNFVRADNIPHGAKIKRTCKHVGAEQKTYTVPGYTENHHLGRCHKVYPIKHPSVNMPMDGWLKFLGIFLAEGSIGGRRHLITISQSTKNKEVRELLKNFPFKVSELKRSFQISSTQLVKHLLAFNFGKCDTKYAPSYVKNLSPRQIKIFLEAFRIGDGCVHKRTKQASYFSTSKKLADDLQELLLKCGIVADIREIKNKGTKLHGTKYFRNHNLYFLAERTKKTDYYIDKRNIKKIKYNGWVHCVEVPNHIIYVRRNGKAFFCGNCRFGYPHISIAMEGVTSGWGDFLHSIAKGENYELKTKKGFQIGVVVAVPPFPYNDPSEMNIYKDLSIIFKKPNLDGVHLGDVKLVDESWRIAGDTGYALVVTGSGTTVEDARKQVYSRLENILLQNMFYRTDIGLGWSQDSDKLQTWGYLH
ncbi:MAG: LAGLIDADG family homing endonuclease [bacterium]